MGRSLEQIFSDAYFSGYDAIAAGLPESVNSGRRQWLENFNLMGVPSAKEEGYRHCDLKELLTTRSGYHFGPDRQSVTVETDGGRSCRVRLIDGMCTGFLTALDDGIIYGSLRAALNVVPEIALEYYNRAALNGTEALASLNSLFMTDGAFVYIPAGVQAQKPLVIDCEYTAGERGRFSFPRILIIAGEDSKATVAIGHRSGSGSVVADAIREVFTGEGCRLSITEYVDMPSGSFFIGGNYTRQEKGSHADSVTLYAKAGICRINSVTDLAGSDCRSELYSLYLGAGREITDLNVRINHLHPDCESMQLIKGIVSGDATGSFTGRVYVAPDAQKTAAYQQSRNLQLSDSARIYTEPQLEIYADDVKCSHGATVGQMDDEAVYYMRQRGISEKEARRLQLTGFVNDVLSHCADEQLCSHLLEMAENRINEL